MKKDDRKHSFLLSTLMLAAVVLSVAVLTLFILQRYEVIDLSGKGETPESESVIPGDEGRFLEALQNGSAEGVTVTYDIGEQDVYALLKKNPPITCFYLANTFTYYGETKNASGSNKIWRDGDRFRIQTYEGDALVQTVVSDGRIVYVSQSTDDTFFSFPYSEHFEVESYARMPRARDFFELPSVSDLSITLFRDESDTLYHVSYQDTALSQIERLFLSLEYGLVLKAESYADQKLVYSLETTEIHGDLSAFNTDVLFIW